MKDRINHIMQVKGLSPKSFAEAIGISQASLSHILSGRNNATLPIVQKILKRFPDVTFDWLVEGTGEYAAASGNLLNADTYNNGANSSTPDGDNTPYCNNSVNDSVQNGVSQSLFEAAPEAQISNGAYQQSGSSSLINDAKSAQQTNAYSPQFSDVFAGGQKPMAGVHQQESKKQKIYNNYSAASQHNQQGDSTKKNGTEPLNVQNINPKQFLRQITEIRVFFDDGTYQILYPGNH